MFKAVITDIPLLRDSISSIAEIIDEGIFKINKDGISLVAADRAMVAVVDLNIFSKAFEKFELDKDISIGLNVSNLLSVIKRASPDDKITMNLQNNKLELMIEGSSKRRFTVPILDLSQEEVPPIDQLEFTSDAEIRPEIIESGIQDAEIVADSVLFETSPSKFVMRAEGDVSRAELELEKGNESLLSLKAESEIRSRYPLDYLKKMIKASKISDSVSIKFGQDYPMKLEFKAKDKASLNFVLAPRVESE